MAKTPLQTVTDNWTKRSRNLARLGVSPDKFSQLAQADINKVAQGGTGMTDQEVYDAAVSGAYNQPVIKDPTRHHGILDVLGNIPKDIGDITTGFIPGAINLVHHLPSETTSLGSYLEHTLGSGGQAERNWEQSHGYEDSSGWSLSHLAAGFRNITKNPLLSFAPGIADIASATTSAGRQHLEEHPVGALLNLAPEAGTFALGEAATRLAYGADAAELGGYAAAGAKAAEEGISPAKAALMEGKPLKALVRTGPIGEGRLALMQKFGWDPQSMEVTRGGSAVDIKAQRELKQFMQTHVNPILDQFRDENGVIDDQKMADITAKAQDPRIPRSAEDEALINALQAVTDKVSQMYKEAGKVRPITWNGHEFLFSTEGAQGEVLKALDAIPKAEARVAKAQDIVHKAEAEYFDRFLNQRGMPQPPEYDKLNPENNRDYIPRYQKYQEDLKRWEQERQRELKKLATKKARLDKIQKAAQRANKHYQSLLHKTAPAEYVPMLEQDIRDRVTSQLRSDVDPETGKLNGNLTLDQALNDIKNGRFDRLFSEPDGYWSEANFNKLKGEVAKTWQDLEKQGYHPMWVHTTDIKDMETLNRVRPLSHTPTPSAARSKTLNFTPKVTNAAVAISSAAAEFLRMKSSEEYITNYLAPQALKYDDVLREIQPEVDRLSKQAKGTISEAVLIKKVLGERYVKLTDQFTGGMTTPRLKPIMDQELYLPDYLAKASREFTNPKIPGATTSILFKGNRIFKTSVLAFSPNFVAHHLLGGTLSLIGRSGFEEFLPETLSKALHLARNPDELNPRLSQGVDLTSTDDMTSFLMGDKAGRILHAAGKAANFNFKVVNFISNMQRAMAYLGEEARGLKEGLSPEMARERGITHANKVFVDWHGMSAVERNAIRTAIPFYGFTKQVLRYALTYPIDHPYRASILANLAEAEQSDWTSGLPRSFLSLFMFGKGDNKLAVNYSTINPYRDIANDFTLTGLFQSLNPFAKGTLTAAGLNTLGGTPELYPQVTYDPTTGNLVAKRPSDGPLSIIQSFIPEVGTLDHFLQLSSSMRRLAATNPTNYRRQLFSSLGIPFVPYTVNVPYAAEKAELNRYKYAQQEVSQAVKSGDASYVANLNLVPYQGQLYTPNELQQILDQMRAVTPKGYSPKSVSKYKPKKASPILEGQQALGAIQ